MTAKTTTINLTNSDNLDDTESTSGKIIFHNSEAVSIDLTLPQKGGSSCFSPPATGTITLAAGGNSGTYQINSNANGNYDYSWKDTGSAELDARSGRIVIN
ncbi:MAG: hypothetical protein WBN09_02130 [Woeseiaceae bacterium]